VDLYFLLFWLSLCSLGYIYAGYPALVWVMSRLRPRAVRKAAWQKPLSVVIVGHNEAHSLPRKLDSLFRSSSAPWIVEVLVGSDGSTDDTAEVVARYPDERVRLLAYNFRRGKPAVLNEVVPRCRSEVVILTDARQEVDPLAIERLTANFADEHVGVVSGELMFRPAAGGDTAVAEGIGSYWAYEKFIRKCESRFRSVPGATGALYALRRELFRPIAVDTLLDDVVIPMQAVEAGYRCLLESDATAWDTPSQSTRQETVRKRRTIAGCAQLALKQPRWLLPWANPIWWEFVSHKLLRLASPLLLVTLLVANIPLSARTPYAWGLFGQGLFYLAALVGWFCQLTGHRLKSAGIPLMFLSLNLTTLAALWDASRGRFQATWQRAQ
jgi:cellulose synthase/poly-beta-1,6-N-acetylglucosamine synthase-like glycosyltransferase